MNSSSDGISFNTTLSLPTTSDKPYIIKVNLTHGGKTYYKISKILYYDSTELPQISSIFSTTDIERSGSDSLDIDATLDGANYDVHSYLSILPFSYYNVQGTINKTIILSNSIPNPFEYSNSYSVTSTDPSGFTIFYILPYNPSFNYYNPYSPRLVSEIVNNPPEFVEETSSFIILDSSPTIFFNETHTEDSISVIQVSQGDQIEFEINLIDSVSYEDQDSSEMRVSVNLFIVSISEDNNIVPITPRTYIYSDLVYISSSNTHNGRFIIPYTMSFSSITGTKQLSTASQYDTISQDGYLAILRITAFDSEGASEYFIIALLIQPSLALDLALILIIIGVVVVIGIIIGILLYLKRRKRTRILTSPGGYYEQYRRGDSTQESYEYIQENVYYCPYCGYQISSPRIFCPSCGKSLKFQE
jgi:hypothetical protein